MLGRQYSRAVLNACVIGLHTANQRYLSGNYFDSVWLKRKHLKHYGFTNRYYKALIVDPSAPKSHRNVFRKLCVDNKSWKTCNFGCISNS